MTEIEDLGNYSNNLDQLLLLRNKCAKLEVEVQKKESEKQNIFTLYTDLKALFEKQSLEIQAQTLKLNTALEEKQKMQARYQTENQKQNNNLPPVNVYLYPNSRAFKRDVLNAYREEIARGGKIN